MKMNNNYKKPPKPGEVFTLTREELAFHDDVRRRGSAWFMDQLADLVGPQLVLLHIANRLAKYPETVDCAPQLFDIIERLDRHHGNFGGLNTTLLELYLDDFLQEPRPKVLVAWELHLGEFTAAVLDNLRGKWHEVEGNRVQVPYGQKADPYSAIDAVNLADEIVDFAVEAGYRGDDLYRGERLKPIFGLGPQSA
jgi:hypothetical protein